MGSRSPRGRAVHRVAVVGGGASGTLVAIHLLRAGGTGLDVTIIEPRATLGLGVAFATQDSWHRLNVPAVTMSGLPDDPDHFHRWAGIEPTSFPSRSTFGRYLGSLLHEAAVASAGSLVHVRTRATALTDGPRGLAVELEDGEALAADAVVIATGNELPAVPPFLASLANTGDPRLVRDPWAVGALDVVAAEETVAIVGTGHTALDLAASLIRGRACKRVIALSRHGEVPRSHEDPWRPRPPVPAFSVDEFRSFHDPIAEARARIRAYEAGWRQGLDSIRPILTDLWLAMDDDLRGRFVREWRREWELHRSRIPAQVARDVEAWRAAGILEVRQASIARVEGDGARLRIEAAEGAWLADRLLLATGPSEAATASAFLASAIGDGLLRPGPVGLGIDVDPAALRVVDAAGSSARPIHAVGPVLRGALWETIAIPEIRAQASRIAMLIGAAAG